PPRSSDPPGGATPGRPPSRSGPGRSGQSPWPSSRWHSRRDRRWPGTSTGSAPTRPPCRWCSSERRESWASGCLLHPDVAAPTLHVPVERSSLPHVDEGLEDEEGEDADGGDAVPAEGLPATRPGEQEDDLDVEDHEQHGDEIELDREPLGRLDFGDDAGLVRSQLLVGG